MLSDSISTTIGAKQPPFLPISPFPPPFKRNGDTPRLFFSTQRRETQRYAKSLSALRVKTLCALRVKHTPPPVLRALKPLTVNCVVIFSRGDAESAEEFALTRDHEYSRTFPAVCLKESATSRFRVFSCRGKPRFRVPKHLRRAEG